LTSPSVNEYQPQAVDNFLSKGLASLKEKALKRGRPLSKLCPLAIQSWSKSLQELQLDEDGDVSSSGDDEPNSDEDSSSDEKPEGSSSSQESKDSD
jgi:hypothetical protein